ncbi:hypothetical protein [Nostoc cycadae]|nr:hypothetical protein [Nostoc cycadae]
MVLILFVIGDCCEISNVVEICRKVESTLKVADDGSGIFLGGLAIA